MFYVRVFNRNKGFMLTDAMSISICSLRERPQVEQLIRYIVEEAPEDAEKQRNFKWVF